MASRAIVSNFFEEQRTPTTFLEIAVYNKWFRPVRGPAATQGNYPLPSRISVAILYRLFAYKLDCIKRRSRLRHVVKFLAISGSEKTLVQQIWQKKAKTVRTCMTFLSLIALRNIVRQCKWPSLSLLRSRNIASMVT